MSAAPRLMTIAGTVIALATLGVAAIGCGSPCPSTERVVDDGARWTAGATRRYQSSPPEGPFIPFEGGTLLHVRHGLGVAPEQVQVMLSFSERPAGGGGYSYAAGNQALVLAQDDREITLKNDSCASYWLRVTAEAWGPPDGDAGPDADASNDDGRDSNVDASASSGDAGADASLGDGAPD